MVTIHLKFAFAPAAWERETWQGGRKSGRSEAASETVGGGGEEERAEGREEERRQRLSEGCSLMYTRLLIRLKRIYNF
jgi:hypothetical protein